MAKPKTSTKVAPKPKNPMPRKVRRPVGRPPKPGAPPARSYRSNVPPVSGSTAQGLALRAMQGDTGTY